MKKIIKKFCLFLGRIFKVFDKILITPIMKLFIKITDIFNRNNKSIERVFANKQALIVISLILAFLVFFYVDSNSNALIDDSAEILYNQPVNAIYNEEAYVIEGLPKTVDVVLVGRKSAVYLAKQTVATDVISVDLRELSVGTHRVNLKYSQQNVDSVEYKIDPSSVTVVIYDKVSDTREVSAEVLNRNELDSKLDISDVTLSQSEVTIKGSANKLKEVAYVKVLIDVKDIVDQEVGKTTVTGKPVAYNNAGEVVDVEILPETVDATLTLTSTSKVVPIRVIPEGTLALGYAIESTTTNISSVTIYGDEDNLKNIEYIPVKIDVNNLSENKSYNINLEKPNGVRTMSEKTITVKINVGKQEQKEIKDVQVRINNKPEGLEAKASRAEDSVITVIVKGSKSLLDNIDASSIIASVDLAEYTTPGVYDVKVKVTGEDLRLTYESKVDKVRVEIKKSK